MSANLAIVIKGELYETEVELQLVHTTEYNEGLVFIKGKALNLTKGLHDILGITTQTGGNDWVIEPTVKLGYISPTETDGFLLYAQMGAFRFVYSSGALAANLTGKGFFIGIDVGELLLGIPGFEKEWLAGEIELGFVKGTTFRQVDKQGKKTFEPVRDGFHVDAKLQVAGQPMMHFPVEKSNATAPQTDIAKSNEKVEVNKTVGPIRLSSFQFNMNKQLLLVSVDADFLMGPIALSFLGLGAEIDLFKISSDPLGAISPKLYGLGLSFQKGDLQIAGVFQKDPSKESYSGGVLIKTKKFALTGFGAYSNEGEYKSIFGFLCLNANIGGDPAFFITGISLCFGYNRQLIVPPIDKIATFPLVRYAMDSGSAPKFDKSNPSANPLVDFNRALGPYIPPKKGTFFFGVGIKFNTYKIMDTVALLVLSIGDDLEFNLIGLSRISLPPNFNGKPLVFIEIALRASYSVNKGLLQVEGQLSNQSYVFSDAVKLTGGFAFYAWFKHYETARAGDFVITVGGYHPNFDAPAHYPKVPRVGFEWQIGSELLISGKMYMALTPCAIMAGAMFNAVWKSGGLFASFSFAADFLMQWKPFKYDARIVVNIQAGFTVSKWGVSKTFSMSIGANLHIWGPDFSGRAELHVRVLGIGVSFSIAFGNAANKVATLSWAEFKSSFLPENTLSANTNPTAEIITIQVNNGLIKEVELDEKIALINPLEFALSVDSMLPVTSFNEKVKGGLIEPNEFVIPATGKTGVKTELELILKRNEAEINIQDEFDFTIQTKQLPRALWNDSLTVKPLDAEQTISLTTGALISAKKEINMGNVYTLEATQFDFSETENYMLKAQNNAKNVDYDDFFLLETVYQPEKFAQISLQDAEEYENYYGDQLGLTSLDNPIK